MSRAVSFSRANGWHSSSQYVHNEPWLDFNMLQSGHYYLDLPNYDMIRRDYIMFPVKPTIDGEPRYENHPVMGNYWPTDHAGWFDHYDVRKAAYWALFSGAFGHTYGCHDVWQMWDQRRKVVNRVRTPWREAVKAHGVLSRDLTVYDAGSSWKL